MPLANFELINEHAEPDHKVIIRPREVIRAYDGEQTVSAFIDRETLYDSIPPELISSVKHSCYDSRKWVQNNFEAICSVITKKYEDREVTTYNHCGSTTLRIDLTVADLRNLA